MLPSEVVDFVEGKGVDIEFLSRICVDEIDQGVEFSSLHRPMANLVPIVVLEEKTSVRVKRGSWV